jgi:protein-tyrosine phosphatase
MPANKVLFLCTGNFYRSRLAEELFNHLARGQNLDWRAESKGLAQDFLMLRNVGRISKVALKELEKRSIKVSRPRFPQKLKPGEADGYKIIIALNQAEHQPLIEKFYPALTGVCYWDIQDIGDESSDSAASRIEANIKALMLEIS